ncbi:TetR family transcriptional regulator [Streptomyces sp. SKN60]|uniref:TetR family transcriptional regulator n=1 Tax=Streptomyces sp. SKN60 TaxID=2855506 RepID=UPI0022469922|nr:TetR family transcriptional regulator [Streptomyces sp. SKN60]MCX2184299.1 TetR family transcriptional regulator [Streptomyces sp. SKN60]
MTVSGLRELKKERTRQTLSDTAVELFLERGFDAVSVAEIAAAAEVSKPTLFRYFPAKEDLALYRFADHEDEPARVVAAARAAGAEPLAALRDHVLAGLARRDPVTGLNDDPRVLAFLRLLYGTPALVARMAAYQGRSEEALAAALGGGSGAASGDADSLAARLAAAQIVAVLRVLAHENVRRVEAGERVAELLPDAEAATREAFRRLAEGLPY